MNAHYSLMWFEKYVSKMNLCCSVRVIFYLFFSSVLEEVLKVQSLTAPALQLLFRYLGSGWSGLALICLVWHSSVKLSQKQTGCASQTTAVNHQNSFSCCCFTIIYNKNGISLYTAFWISTHTAAVKEGVLPMRFSFLICWSEDAHHTGTEP